MDWEPAEADDARQRRAEAKSLFDADPAASLAMHRELAEGGSAFSMLSVAWHYRVGSGTERDLAIAEEYYRRALGAGSWRATLEYAHLLFKRGAHDLWPSTLGDGVQKGFMPASYWLAWYTYQLNSRRKTAREVRPLLEAASAAGHPGAKLVLARWMASGKFGLREIPRGFRTIRELAQSVIGENENQSARETADDSAPAPTTLAAAA